MHMPIPRGAACTCCTGLGGEVDDEQAAHLVAQQHRVPPADRRVLELHRARRVLAHEVERGRAEREVGLDRLALARLLERDRVDIGADVRHLERAAQPGVHVIARARLVAQAHQQLAQVVATVAATHAPESLPPLVVGDEVLVLRAQQPLAQRAVAAELVPQQRLHQLEALPLPSGRQRHELPERMRLLWAGCLADGLRLLRLGRRLGGLKGVLNAGVLLAAPDHRRGEPVAQRLPATALEARDRLLVLVGAPRGRLALERDQLSLHVNGGLGFLPILHAFLHVRRASGVRRHRVCERLSAQRRVRRPLGG